MEKRERGERAICSCCLAWCQKACRDGVVFDRRTYSVPCRAVPRSEASKQAVEIRNRTRDDFISKLRPGGVPLKDKTRAHFLYWHIRPESFHWQTEFSRHTKDRTPRWKLDCIRQPVRPSLTKQQPPPVGEPAAWNGSSWVSLVESPKKLPLSLAQIQRNIQSPVRSARSEVIQRIQPASVIHEQSANVYRVLGEDKARSRSSHRAEEAKEVEKAERLSMRVDAYKRQQEERTQHKALSESLSCKIRSARSNASNSNRKVKRAKRTVHELADISKQQEENERQNSSALEEAYERLKSVEFHFEEERAAREDIERLEREEMSQELDISRQQVQELMDEMTQLQKELGSRHCESSADQTAWIPLRWETFKSHESLAKKLPGFTGVKTVGIFEALADFFLEAGGTEWTFSQPRKTSEPSAKKRKRSETAKSKLTFHDRMLITLHLLRTGSTQEHTSALFGIHEATTSRTFKVMVSNMAWVVNEVMMPPTAKMMEALCPPKLKKEFGNRTVSYFLDATELRVQVPKDRRAQKALYSNYKSHTTAKLLGAFSPVGCMPWVSAAYPGSVSDNVITAQSGFVEQCAFHGHTVLADKGFTVRYLLSGKGCDLYVPPKRRSRQVKLTQEECADTFKVANPRIHVERMFGLVAPFRWLKNVIPIHQVDLITPAFKLVVFLVNVNNKKICDFS